MLQHVKPRPAHMAAVAANPPAPGNGSVSKRMSLRNLTRQALDSWAATHLAHNFSLTCYTTRQSRSKGQVAQSPPRVRFDTGYREEDASLSTYAYHVLDTDERLLADPSASAQDRHARGTSSYTVTMTDASRAWSVLGPCNSRPGYSTLTHPHNLLHSG